VPPARVRYLAEIAETVRGYHADVAKQSGIARERQQLREAKRMLDVAKKPSSDLEALITERDRALSAEAKALLREWPRIRQTYSGDEQVTKIRDREIRTVLTTTSLSGTKVPKVALPKFEDDGETLI
jgi:methylmalonyl-CoA mutase